LPHITDILSKLFELNDQRARVKKQDAEQWHNQESEPCRPYGRRRCSMIGSTRQFPDLKTKHLFYNGKTSLKYIYIDINPVKFLTQIYYWVLLEDEILNQVHC